VTTCGSNLTFEPAESVAQDAFVRLRTSRDQSGTCQGPSSLGRRVAPFCHSWSMRVLGVVWVGTRTESFDETVAFFIKVCFIGVGVGA
jgi:hypothetical protein